MKLAHLRLAALAAFALCLAAPAGRAQDYEKFVKDFRAAYGINDTSQMASLVKAKSVEATWHVDKLCTGIAESPTEDLEREMGALAAAWRNGRGTQFADNYYAYLSLMRSEDKRERARFKRSYDGALKKFNDNLAGDKLGPIFEQTAMEMEGLAQAFTTLGDHYYAGNCWATYAACYNEGYRGKKEVDLAKVTLGFDRALKAFEKIDLKHAIQADIQQNFERLSAEGWKEVADDPDAAAPGEPKKVEAAAVVNVPMEFEALESSEQFERPNFNADSLYQSWQWLQFTANGTDAVFNAQKSGPRVVRVGAAELGVDFDRDGQIDQPIKLTGNKTVVECEMHDDLPRRKWAFLLATGIAEDNFQGLQYYMEPSDLFVNMYYTAAGSVVGDLAGTPVRLIDENCDGIYGGTPLSWAYNGLTADNYQWETDSMVVGNSKRAIPFSKYAEVGDQWYELESQNGGTTLTATPVEVTTGKLKLSFKGPPVSWLVVKGQGNLEGSYFDVLASKSGTEVPIGTYTLLVGEVRKGKKAQTMKTLILPGETTPNFVVAAGKTSTIELGSPFGFDFKTTRGPEGVTVLGKSVVITGKAGERYERPWNCVSRPEVAIRKPGAKKGNKPEEMDVVLDMLEMDGNGGFRFSPADPWFPLDTTFPFVGDEYEVQLTEKKNKLFGKIESEWK